MSVRVFVASKQYMVEGWQRLREQVIDVEFTARWIDPHPHKSQEDKEKVCLQNQQDIERSDVVLVYGDAEDTLIDTLVAAGMGIMAGKTIICVGSSKSFGDWQHHSNVFRKKTVMEAINLAKELFAHAA